MREERDDKFIFKVNMLSRLPELVEISHEWVLTNFNYQEPKTYAKCFDDPEKGPSEAPPGHTNKYQIIKSVPDDPTLHDFQEIKSACVIRSFSSVFYLIGDKIASNNFKDTVTPLLKSNYWSKNSQDVATNHVRDNVKTQYKISYIVFKENMDIIH